MPVLFSDDFNRDELGPKWYARDTDYRAGRTMSKGDLRAVAVQDGRLHLKTIPDPDNFGKYLTGHIGADFQFTHGYASARIKFAPGRGGHGAWWLQTTEDYIPGQAEIDIAEHRGATNPRRKTGVAMSHNVYWREPGQVAEQFTGIQTETNSAEFLGLRIPWSDDFHTYRLRWTPTQYVFSIDRKVVAIIKGGLSSRPKFPVLSMITRDYEYDELVAGGGPGDMIVEGMRIWR